MNYWQNRFLKIEDILERKAYDYLKESQRFYIQAKKEIERDILRFYEKDMTLAKAKRRLDANELKEFKTTVDSFMKDDVSDSWKKQLERASKRQRISHLEAVRIEIQHHIEVLTMLISISTEETLKDIFNEGYLRALYEFGYDGLFDKSLVELYIMKAWAPDGSNFSERIWGKYRPQLVAKLHKELTLSIIKGDDPKDLIRKIAKEFDVEQHRAATLIYTEKAFMHSVSQKEAFKSLNVERYEIVATLDNRTSKICQDMDGRVYELSEYEIGTTAPPFHPRCRTVTAPYFEGNVKERIARDPKTGKTYTVPKMTYKEWLKTLERGE